MSRSIWATVGTVAALHRSTPGGFHDDKNLSVARRDGRSYESPTEGLFGGNKRGKIYGRLDCPVALAAIKRGRIYQQHRVSFADEANAVAAGFRLCASVWAMLIKVASSE
jgi:hypothetical protein